MMPMVSVCGLCFTMFVMCLLHVLCIVLLAPYVSTYVTSDSALYAILTCLDCGVWTAENFADARRTTSNEEASYPAGESNQSTRHCVATPLTSGTLSMLAVRLILFLRARTVDV